MSMLNSSKRIKNVSGSHRANSLSVNDTSYEEQKFYTCADCVNGVMTARGPECSKNLALTCKPFLLNNPKNYLHWMTEE